MADAQATGFRACKRCNPDGPSPEAENAAIVAKACRLIEQSEEAPSLTEPCRSGPHVRVPPRLAIGFALALHELSTNAAKYGALSVPEGYVFITWKVVDGWKPDRLHVSWEERGGPLVVPPSRVGFGSKLIKRVLASEIAGTVELEYKPSGVCFTAIAPLPECGDEQQG